VVVGSVLILGSGTSQAAPAPGPPVVSTGSSNLFTAAAMPCSAPAGSTTCAAEPTSIEATWPFLNTGISGIEVTWMPAATRPAAAPAPAQLTVALPVSAGTCNGAGDDCTWPWPTLLEPASSTTVLNGTYQVVACGGSPIFGAACQSGSPYQAVEVSEGVAPAAPTAVRATVSGVGVVAVTWPLGPEADLAGYEVTASSGGQSRLIGACTLSGAPAPSADPSARACPSPLQATDAPAAGTWTYDVTALRYGTDGSAATLVSSPATGVEAEVTAAEVAAGNAAGGPGGSGSTASAAPGGTPAGAGAGGATGSGPAAATSSGGTTGAGGFVLPKAPVLPTRSQSTPLAQAPADPTESLGPTTTVAPDSGFAASLPFKAAGSDQPVAVAAAAAPPARLEPTHGVSRWAAFAGGLLVLAVAAHLLYLRAAVARYRRARPPAAAAF
jgi:hypothetical protein